MKLTISRSKNSISYYISQSYINDSGKSTTKTIRKLGTLAELSARLGTDQEGVEKWAREQARIETEKYNAEKDAKTVLIPFNTAKNLEYYKKARSDGGYLFLQSIYYQLNFEKICRKIKAKHNYEYDLNAVLSDLIYTRIIAPSSKCSSYETAKKFS